MGVDYRLVYDRYFCRKHHFYSHTEPDVCRNWTTILWVW